MTDTMFTHTALTATALLAGVTTDQARTILEAAGVELAPEPIEPGLYLMAQPTGPRPVLVDRDGSLALISDEGDMLEGLVSSAEERKALTPARAVPVTAAPVTLTEDQVGEEWNRHKTEYMNQWKDSPQIGRTVWTNTVNALLAQHAAPAEGELIDVADVREGDRVRVELRNGDEATFTVTRVDTSWFESGCNCFLFSIIRSVHLLHREEV